MKNKFNSLQSVCFCFKRVNRALTELFVPIQPPTGTDTMVKAGVTTSINTKHQCITAMKEYENKSLEVSLTVDTQTSTAAAYFSESHGETDLNCQNSPVNVHAGFREYNRLDNLRELVTKMTFSNTEFNWSLKFYFLPINFIRNKNKIQMQPNTELECRK